jgi:predicted amidophosphoribosyltransferase
VDEFIAIVLVTAFGAVLVALFVRLAFDVFAIRKMIEARGGDSPARCPQCRFPIPADASICGHCGRELTRADAP